MRPSSTETWTRGPIWLPSHRFPRQASATGYRSRELSCGTVVMLTIPMANGSRATTIRANGIVMRVRNGMTDAELLIRSSTAAAPLQGSAAIPTAGAASTKSPPQTSAPSTASAELKQAYSIAAEPSPGSVARSMVSTARTGALPQTSARSIVSSRPDGGCETQASATIPGPTRALTLGFGAQKLEIGPRWLAIRTAGETPGQAPRVGDERSRYFRTSPPPRSPPVRPARSPWAWAAVCSAAFLSSAHRGR